MWINNTLFANTHHVLFYTNTLLTRLHSSRMRTACALTVYRGGRTCLVPGGVYLPGLGGGVPAWPGGGVPVWSRGCTCLVLGGGCTCLVRGGYLPGPGGVYLSGPRGVYLPCQGGTCLARGVVPAWSREGVYLPGRGGTCLALGGYLPGPGGVPAWPRGGTCLVPGGYLPGPGGYLPGPGGCTWSGTPRGQNS